MILTKNKELSEKYFSNKYCTESDDFARTLRQKWKFLLFLLRCNVSLGRNEISALYKLHRRPKNYDHFDLWYIHTARERHWDRYRDQMESTASCRNIHAGTHCFLLCQTRSLHRFCFRAVWVSHNTKTVDNVKSHSVGYGPFLKTDGIDTVYCERVQIDERKRYSHTQPYLAWKTGCYRRSI